MLLTSCELVISSLMVDMSSPSYELHSKVGDRQFQEQAYKHLVGVIVLTR